MARFPTYDHPCLPACRAVTTRGRFPQRRVLHAPECLNYQSGPQGPRRTT